MNFVLLTSKAIQFGVHNALYNKLPYLVINADANALVAMFHI